MSQTSIFRTLEDLRTRTTEAVIGQSGLNHLGLAQELRRRLGSADPSHGGVMQQAVIEAAPNYLETEETLGDLAGGLLHPATVDALDGSDDDRPNRYRFRAGWRPYSHQVAAWRELSHDSPPRSVLVTSGTGSGKTECFLVPIIDDLVRQSGGAGLEGVQAVILYPLNALIASQEERLRDWTAPFNGRLRFCLYNGLLEEEVPSHQQAQRAELVADRKRLRESPPPILVTNVTMLEYMLLRKEDAPILAKSQGKLRYVVLDEAHSYVGAKAAEIALLLRRTCLGFGVRPEDVRFIATSATIGGSNAKLELQKFLSDVAGVPLEQVSVIEGQPHWSPLPPVAEGVNLERALAAPEEVGSYEALASSASTRPLLERLRKGPLSWSMVQQAARNAGASPEALVRAISSARKDGDLLSPLRVHAFHRAIPGLWTCLNGDCSRSTPDEWPFGSISTEDVEQCVCGSPTFEVVLCNACGEAYVDVAEQGDGTLTRARRALVPDEYALEAESAEDSQDGDEVGAEELQGPGSELHHRLASRKLPESRPLYVDITSSRVFDGPSGARRTFHRVDGSDCRSCPACHTSRQVGAELIRSFRFGAPFILQNTVPVLLESAARATEDRGIQSVPIDGRQILSFTDSRQGTARFSAKLQFGSERNFVRSFVYHAVQQARSRRPDTADLDGQISDLRAAVAHVPSLAGTLARLESDRDAIASAANAGINWAELVVALAKRVEVRSWLTELWSRRDPRFQDPEFLAEFLLLREFFRRPRRAVSIETLGLAKLCFPAVDLLPAARLPKSFSELGGTSEDWKDYLNIILTYMVRENAAVNVSPSLRRWIQPSIFSTEYVKTRDDCMERWQKPWPSIRQGDAPLGVLSRPVILLAQGLGVPLEDTETRAAVQECLDEAWFQLASLMSPVAAVGRQLEFSKARISPMSEAWLCPITRRLLDGSFRGLTPYGAASRSSPARTASPVTLPDHPFPFLGAEQPGDRDAALELVSDWLATNPAIAELRDQGAWSDISDRVALFADYFRSAEHSAQQPPHRLRAYEAEFKRGEINILNCSTTMEMGVDIGSVSHVMMTNVPPSLASYRQRIGRAGRRRQPLSLGFTFCKDRPLDRAAFSDPIGFLARSVAAPRVALDSQVIVQRHVNALLFAAFIKDQAGDALKMQAGPFFGCGSAAGAKEQPDCPAHQMADFIELPSTQSAYRDKVAHLVRGSVLADDDEVFDAASADLRRIRAAFRAEWAALQAVRSLGGTEDSAMNRGLAIQLKRMCEDYLLSVLSGRGFLPSHGFPTGVVSFVCRTDDPQAASGAPSRRKSYPQRQLDMAIREYSPGSEVVIDGLVHRSAGVTLNWRQPASADGVREIQNLLWRWRCSGCGESGTSRNRERSDCPSCSASPIRWDEYLEPAGFAADLRETPHADPDLLTHVAAEPPAVTIQDQEWASLIDPALGRMRSSREGRVFYCNAGPGRYGYKLCLQCGRAEPAAQTEASDAPESSAWSHRPLLAKPDANGECPGSTRPFSVKQSLRLGHEISTDVFELQLAGLDGTGAGLAITIALRESLARLLGIEPDEMGFSVESRRGPFGSRLSLFLFDRASGGAGFSIQAPQVFSELLREAATVLDCAVPGCVNGCPACVLVADLNEAEASSLDRQQALAIVRDLARVTAPKTHDQAGPNAYLVSDALDALDRAVTTGAYTVRLRVEGDLDLEGLASWGAAARVRRWSGLGRVVVLSISREVLGELDGASRLGLRDRLHEWGARLEEGSGALLENGARVLAEAEGAADALIVATRDMSAFDGNQRWARVGEAPLVAFRNPESLLTGLSVSIDRLQPPLGATVQAITDQLNGDLARFGKRTAELLRGRLQAAGAPDDQQIIALSYSDRYLSSPLVVRLALETFKELARPEPGVPIPLTLELEPLRPSDRPMRALWDNWKRGDDRLEVISNFGRRIGLAVTTHEGSPRHGRVLSITYAGGATATILLDQGFGAWEVRGGQSSFDFRATPAQQTNALAMANTALQARSGGTYVVAHLGVV